MAVPSLVTTPTEAEVEVSPKRKIVSVTVLAVSSTT